MSTSSADSGGSNGSPRGRHYFSSSSRARTYTCKICRNEFNSGQSLGGHMNVHRKDQRSPRSGSHSSCSSTPPNGDCYSSTSDSSSTYKGVRYRSEQNKWVAEIRPPKSNKTWWLGTYSTPVEAAYAYDVAITYFGSETSLNFDGHPVYDQIPRISPNLPKQDFAVQLRKVVKEYGKLAMQSDERGEVEFEPSASAYGTHDQYNSSPAYDHQQQAEDVMWDFDEIGWDEFPATFPDVEAENVISSNYDAPFDFDMPPVTYNEPDSAYYNNGYQPNEPSFYNQMSSAMSVYEPNGCWNRYQSAQQQFWAPYCNQ